MKIKKNSFTRWEIIDLLAETKKVIKISRFFNFETSYKTIKQWVICFGEAKSIQLGLEQISNIENSKKNTVKKIIFIKRLLKRADKLIYEFSKHNVFFLFRFFYWLAIRRLDIEQKNVILNTLIQHDTEVKKKKFFYLTDKDFQTFLTQGIAT